MLPDMAHDGLLVGDLARKAGTTRKALRLYEAAGLLSPARRTSSGYRLYSQEALPLLAFILRARRIGFPASARSSRSWVSGDPARRLAGMHELFRRKAADVVDR